MAPKIQAYYGARSYSYSEFHYLGNPGYYQTFVFTASNAAAQGQLGDMVQLVGEIGNELPRYGSLTQAQHAAIKDFRSKTEITTYTVIGMGLAEENYPAGFGPHGDEVRTIP